MSAPPASAPPASALPTTLRGWYSRAAASKNGCSIYETAAGREVPVTSLEDPRAPDAVYVGELRYLVRDVNCGLYFHGRLTRTNAEDLPPDPLKTYGLSASETRMRLQYFIRENPGFMRSSVKGYVFVMDTDLGAASFVDTPPSEIQISTGKSIVEAAFVAADWLNNNFLAERPTDWFDVFTKHAMPPPIEDAFGTVHWVMHFGTEAMRPRHDSVWLSEPPGRPITLTYGGDI